MLLMSVDFLKIIFFKKSLRNIISIKQFGSIFLDQYSAAPDVDPYCLQRLSADNKSYYLLFDHA